MQLQPISINDRDTWNSTLALLPTAHVLQTWEWGDFKAATTGWRPQRIAFMHKNQALAMAQVLLRQEGPFRVMYVPKGPALDWTNADLRRSVLAEIQRLATDRDVIFVKIDPDIVLDMGEPGGPDDQPNPLGHAIRAEWEEAGWLFSAEQIQFRNSVILDLRRGADDLLMDMKSKTRYNIRLSGRKSVDIRFGSPDDMDLLYDLYATTAARDGFVIRPLSYYRQAWERFLKAGLAQPILAE
jgi:lipid II:glycine glycyltransferase (peptidoglycan interpeptide bridge formation enzyme)